MKNQKEVMKLSGELWNAILKLPKAELHPDDLNDLRFHIHAIQNILYAQAYIKEHGKL